MHRQPVFRDSPAVAGSVADDLFARGVCLPSGNRMSDTQVDDVSDIVASTLD